jgi:hypothetical protein
MRKAYKPSVVRGLTLIPDLQAGSAFAIACIGALSMRMHTAHTHTLKSAKRPPAHQEQTPAPKSSLVLGIPSTKLARVKKADSTATKLAHPTGSPLEWPIRSKRRRLEAVPYAHPPFRATGLLSPPVKLSTRRVDRAGSIPADRRDSGEDLSRKTEGSEAAR